MEFRQFHYILKIAEEGTLSLAAKKLYVSQPSLSQLLAAQEKKIGAPLFDEDPGQTALRGELLQLLAAPRLLAVLDYAAAFDKQKQPLAVFLDWLQKWLLDIGLAQQNMPPLYYPASREQSAAVAGRTTPAALFRLNGRLNELIPYGRHTLSVKMQLEYLLTEYLHFWQNK